VIPLAGNPNQSVGRFAIKDFLGRGAIGDVLLAWDPVHERDVALKVMRVGKTDPDMLEAERNGVSLQAQLATAAPQVAAVYETGQEGDLYWVAMEYIAGVDLAAVMAGGPLAEARAVAIALELVSMLEVCHDFSAEVSGRRIYGIVHGDIKPENIRLQEADRVRVLDFGIAKHLTQTRRFTVNLFGSLPYTPPERLERGVVDRHSDLWAVGVVLAAMVQGRRPFPGNTPEELEQVLRRGGHRLPLPATCSPGLAHVVDRSLSFEVGRRYQTAAEMKADLAALRDGQPLQRAPAVAVPGVAGAAGDVHATRRTMRPLSAQEVAAAEATRRTERPATGAQPGGGGGDTRRTGAAAAAADGAAAVTGMGAVGAMGLGTGGSMAAGMVAGGAAGAAAAGGGAGSAAGGPASWPTAPMAVVPRPLGGVAADSPAAALPLAAAPALAAPALPAVPAGLPRPRHRLRRALLVLAVAALLAFGGAQLWAWTQAQQLRRDLADAQPDLDAVATRYQQVVPWCWVSADLFGVGDELVRSLTDGASRIFDSYHGDDPTTTQRGWQTAYRLLHTAAQIAPRDRAIRARMLYAHGHLDRIQSIALRTQGNRNQALDSSRQAAAEFQEAAQADPTWPDPFLGLARIYAYDQFDLDALQKTLGELGRRGYHVGRRETAMLADGFRMRGLGAEARADRAGDRAAEAQLLKQAQDDLQQAVRFYGDISGYAAAASNRQDCEEHLEAVAARLAAMRPPRPPGAGGFWERVGRALVHEFAKPGGGGGG
jgi:Protein kinase domain